MEIDDNLKMDAKIYSSKTIIKWDR